MKIQSDHFSYFLVIVAHNIFITGFIYANQEGLHPIETNLLRGLATFLINFCLIRYFGMGMEFKLAANHKYLLIRSGAICVHSLTLAICGFYLPQPVIHTINCTGPIFVIIEDYFLNGTRINSQQLKGIVFTFLGILLTINGESMMNYWSNNKESNNNTDFENYASDSQIQKMLMGTLFAFMAVVWAYGTVAVKSIVGLNSLHINLHFGIFTTLFNALLYPIFVTNPAPPTTMLNGLFLCGSPMAIGNILFIHALNINKNTGLATICISSGVVVGYLISVIRYNQEINYVCLMGSLCIVAGLIGALTANSKEQSKQEKPLNLFNDKDKKDSLQQEQIQIDMINNPEIRR